MIDRHRQVAVLEQPQVQQRVLGTERVPKTNASISTTPTSIDSQTRGAVKSPSFSRQAGDAEQEQREARARAAACRGSRRTPTARGCPWAGRRRRRRTRTTPIGCVDQEDPVPAGVRRSASRRGSARGSGRAASGRRGWPSAGPSGAGPAALVMIVMPSGISMPPPRPCSTRKHDQHVDRRRRTRTAPSRAVNSVMARQVEPLGAEAVGRPAGDRDDGGQGQRVRRDRPRDVGVRAAARRRRRTPSGTWAARR